MRLHGWRNDYKNCLLLPTYIKKMHLLFGSSFHKNYTSKRVLDLEQFWDGWPSKQFSRMCISENKIRWKDSCWFVESVDNPGCYILITGINSHNWLSHIRLLMRMKLLKTAKNLFCYPGRINITCTMFLWQKVTCTML